MTTCPKCRYVRQPTDASPDYECPQCGVIYAKYRAASEQRPDSIAQPISIDSSSSLKSIAATGIKRFVKFIAWFLALCVLVVLYGYISRNMDEREFKKSQAEEHARRQTMTPDQRIAEDKAKADAAAVTARVSARKAMHEAGKIACTSHWKAQLKDPYSAILEGFEGGVDKDSDDLFYAEISGRAKNSFGAYMPGTWVCSAVKEGGKIRITHFSQLM